MFRNNDLGYGFIRTHIAFRFVKKEVHRKITMDNFRVSGALCCQMLKSEI